MTPRHPLPEKHPEATPRIGVIGGGQLGMFLVREASRKGWHSVVFAQSPGEPAVQRVSREAAKPEGVLPPVLASFDDEIAQDRFLDQVSAVAIEFENIPLSFVHKAEERGIPVSANSDILATAQSRLHEKAAASLLGIATPTIRPLRNHHDLLRIETEAPAELFPAILKTNSGGYDGKGQCRVTSIDELQGCWDLLERRPALLEQEIPFKRELSILVARNRDGSVVTFPVSENRHEQGILRDSICLSTPTVQSRIDAYAKSWAGHFELTGIVCLEFFETIDGELLLNESAPRPHNSYHWTLDSKGSNQFATLLDALVGLPLSEPRSDFLPVRMTNIIGEDPQTVFERIQGSQQARGGHILYDYMKKECRTGRKMGHINSIL
ncbi:MAG: ATP-grasp domain-containing protein [Alphaproteobacteria bacterium]|nr:ATP-grasp domain-containing protein [Alphaproteobacteria bacterium]